MSFFKSKSFLSHVSELFSPVQSISRRIGKPPNRRRDRQFVLTNTVLPVIITPVLYAAYSLFDDEISEVSRKFEYELYITSTMNYIKRQHG